MTELISFLGGFFLAGFLAYVSCSRLIKAINRNPLVCPPPNKHAQHLVAAAKIQMDLWKRVDFRLDAEDPQTMREALQRLGNCSSVPSVWIVESGIVWLPDGSSFPIARLAAKVEQAMENAYRALDSAASVVLDYADRLPHGALEKEGQLLHSCKFAFERELHELARILGLDPQKNEVARFGGAELWNRQSARIFPPPFIKKQYDSRDAGVFAEKALIDIAHLANSLPDRRPDSAERALKAIERLAISAYRLPRLAVQVGTGDPLATQEQLDMLCAEHELTSRDIASVVQYG